MKCCAIIPARGGSKGIPLKSIALLAGRPLLANTILAASGAHLVDRVVVTTDHDHIAAIATECGAYVVDRPAELAEDASSSEAALLHALQVLQRREHYVPDLTCFLQCTSPFTSAQDIDGAINHLLVSGADSVLAAAAFHGFLWQQAPDGRAKSINHDAAHRIRRQDRQPEYQETGSVYVMRTEGFISARHRFFGRTELHVLPRDRLLEIDEPDDLRLAEALMTIPQ